jgi:class 3 adenylate cyclase/WD40 repeat protein/tRNA A-37 threonylcarbamoyl transferase component Bud32
VLTLVRGRYEVLETLGSGGEARIVKALDRQHDRIVALKIRPVRDEARREDLLGEARVLLGVPPHPALPLVREDFFDGDDYIVAMDWVDGTDLATLLRDRGRPGLATSSVLAYLAQAAEALTHLHSQSPPVIHGDVKPGNLILTKGGKVKLVDFGLSSAPNAPRRRSGTPGFRAPELAAGGGPSRAGDVYALAATAFALLTGSAPAGFLPAWDGIDPAQAEQLEAAIRLGMATDSARRPATPGELVERLRAGWTAALPTGVVTFCFSDIEGSTALWDAHPEAMAEALVRHDELIADAVEARGGSVIPSMGKGDSTVSVFDSAPLAVEAALAANRALAGEDWPAGIRIAVRWGLHTGETERHNTGYRGPTVIVAARVRGQADGGQIFLSSVTSALADGHLPPGCSLVDLGPHRLKGIGTPERISALGGEGVSTPLPATDCPYRGLLAFEADDRLFFSGREEVVAALIGSLAPGRLLAVVGASGSGKSSVLRAGLVAAARSGEIAGIQDAVLLTPGAEPEPDLPDAPDRLVVVDQFEELFTLCDDPARRDAFIGALLALRCTVAIGVRADLYGRIGGHPELARAVAHNHVLLGAMTPAELERAVTEPARLAGLKLEPGLVEIILRDVAAEPGALPLLSHALRATWERRDGRTLTLGGYQESGGVGSAIARTADAIVDELPAEQRRHARSVYVRMTELGEGTEDSRRRVPVDELVPEGASPDTVRALLERLAHARLVTLDDGSAEVAHEALIREWPRLRGWLDEDRAGIRAHRQLSDAARVWQAGGREASDLYRGARLAGAVDLAQAGRAELNAAERAFLDASLAEADRERRAQQRTNRRLRGLLAGASVLLLVAVAAGILSFVQRDNAQQAEAAAERQALRSDAERVGALARTAPGVAQSMLFAVAGIELQDRLETRGDLLAVLQRNPAALRTLHLRSTGLTALAAGAGGRLLATGDETGAVRLIDLRSWTPAGEPVRLGAAVGVHAMQFAPGGRTLAVGTQRGDRYELHLVDVRTHRARRVWSRDGLPADAILPTLGIAYDPGGRWLALAVTKMSTFAYGALGQRLLLLDARTGRARWERPVPLRPEQGEAHVHFGPRGRLVTSASGGATVVWDARRGRIVQRHSAGGNPALAPDGRTLAFIDDRPPGSRVVLLDLRTGRRTRLSQALPDERLLHIAFAADGSQIVGSTPDGLHVWDRASGRITESFGGGVGMAIPGFVLDGRGSVIAGAGPGAVGAWDLDGAQRLGRRVRWGPAENACVVNPCTVSVPRGNLVATAQGDGTVALVDIQSGRRMHTFPARNGAPITALAVTADGGRIASGGPAGTVTFWDVATREPVRRVRYAAPVFAAAISPDGRLLAVTHQAQGANDAKVEVRDLASGRTLFTRGVRGGAGDLQFTRDARAVVASGCCRGGSTVASWDARTGTVRFDRTTEDHAITFALTPDSRAVLVGDEDGAVRWFDTSTGRELGAPTSVAAEAVSQIAVSPDGRRFAVSDFGGDATLWDIRSRKRVGDAFPVGRGVVPSVTFDPRGRLLITELGSATAWPIGRSDLQRFACRVAGRDLTREEWRDLIPGRPYRRVCPGRG